MTKSKARADRAGWIGFALLVVASIFLIVSFFAGWAFAGIAAVASFWGALFLSAADHLRKTEWSVGDPDGRDD